MADNVQKKPLGLSLNRHAAQAAMSAIQTRGKSLPCTVVKVSGATVEVAFQVQGGVTLPNVTMPIQTSKYVREPLQVGDPGLAVAADFYLGGVSGLGGGTADLSQRGNLTTLTFMPVGNVHFSTTDANAVCIAGPNGVALGTTGGGGASLVVGTSSLALSAPTEISFSAGGHTVTLNAAGLTIDGTVFALHEHTLTQPGTGVSGPVAP